MSEPNGAQQTLTLEDLDRFVKGPVETAPDDELTRYLDAAAVLVAFNPDQLRPVGGASTEPAERETVRAGLAALSELIDDGPQRGLWSLSFAERRDGLRRLGNRERMRQALDANPERPESPVQRMFERVVNDDAFVLAHLPRDELAALITVIGWLNGIVEPLPNEAAMRSALASADHLAPMRRLADASFVDRQTQLEQIGAYALDGVDRPTPLFVFGPGGVGKSALLAKFILDSLHRENVPSFISTSTGRPCAPIDR